MFLARIEACATTTDSADGASLPILKVSEGLGCCRLLATQLTYAFPTGGNRPGVRGVPGVLEKRLREGG